MRPCILLFGFFLWPMTAHSQWSLLDAHTTANLRGIDAIGEGIVWASGANGTVIRSTDDGTTWHACGALPGAEKLELRAIQALNAKVAVVMSVGTGTDSRVYKTIDSCKTWKLTYTNPDAKGFFDSMRHVSKKTFYILGDPVEGKFSLFISKDLGDTWDKVADAGLEASPGAGAFAASNTSFTAIGSLLFFAGKGVPKPPVYSNNGTATWQTATTDIATGTSTSGIFSIAARSTTKRPAPATTILVAVGGVYNKPAQSEATATFSTDGGHTWKLAQTPPRGYRSCVAYDASSHAWIAVGPNGTDISTDDGNTWKSLGADPTLSDNWNALSLPFVVGPKGRVGKLNRTTLQP